MPEHRKKPKRPASAKSRRKSGAKPSKTKGKRWSQRVTEQSNALELESTVFKRGPREMARSLKRSAERSKRRKASPFKSAMSMLSFYENRAGKGLSGSKKRVLAAAKRELRRLYKRSAS